MDEVEFPRLLTVAEVAEILCVPVSTVHHWAVRGEGPPSFKVGKHRRFDAERVRLWLEDAKGQTTKANYRNGWRHVNAQFGRWPVAKIEHADVADWVTAMGRVSGPDQVRYSHRVLCLVLDHAMKSRRVPVNVARGIRLPRRPPAREQVLTAPQVQELAELMGAEGDVVMAMAYLGLRWSELAALKVADVDLTRHRVHVVERALEVGGRVDVAAPKSQASNRHIAIPGLLVPMLERRVEGRPAIGLVFPAPGGGYLRNGNWRTRSGFNDATKALGLDVTPHDLRRTFGSLARAAGADLRWIQKAMGHESITTTARIYAHLYDDELDSVAAALDRIGRGG